MVMKTCSLLSSGPLSATVEGVVHSYQCQLSFGIISTFDDAHVDANDDYDVGQWTNCQLKMKIFLVFDEHVAHIVGLGGDEEEEDLLLQSCVGSCRNWGRWLLARLPPEMFSCCSTAYSLQNPFNRILPPKSLQERYAGYYEICLKLCSWGFWLTRLGFTRP